MKSSTDAIKLIDFVLDKWVRTLPKCINHKIDITARLEFELTYSDAV